MKTQQMNNMLRILDYQGTDNVAFFTCPCRECPGSKEIEDAYSERHAGRLGWKWSKDIKFSKDGEKVYICPDCIERTDKEKDNE